MIDEMMNFNDFLDHLQTNLMDYLPKEFAKGKINIIEKQTVNGGNVTEVTVRMPDDVVSPCITVDEGYIALQNGIGIENVCDKIANDIVNAKNLGVQFELPDFSNFGDVKEMLKPKIINLKDNRNFLNDIPYTKIADLAVIYQVEITNNAVVTVNNSLLNLWDRDIPEVHEIALDNAAKEGHYLSRLDEMIFTVDPANYFETMEVNPNALMVLGSKSGMNGAYVVADKDVLRKTGEILGDDFYLIPSSIHEIIVVPKNVAETDDITPAGLGKMVREVNREVDKTERLSDHIYEFNRDTLELEVVQASREKEKEATR